MSQQFAIARPDSMEDGGRQLLIALLSAVHASGAATLADALMCEFGSLARVLGAGTGAQRRVIGECPDVLRCLTLVRETMLHALATEVAQAPVLSNTDAVLAYLHVAMAHELREQVRALFLDNRHRLIRDEVLGEGCVATSAVYPRQIMCRALELGATGLVLAHNHPSGNLQPSRDDIQITRALVEAGRALGIAIHDHLIIARTGNTSLRALGFI